MNKNDALMTRARRIDPAPAEAFEGLASSPEGQETLNAILESAPVHQGKSDHVVAGSPRQHQLGLGGIARRTVAIGVAAAVVIGIATIAAPDRPVPDSKTVWDAELVSIAQQSPRLLLDGDEWRVSRADEFSAELGEMTFQNGRDCDLLPLKEGCYWVSLFWRPADTHTSYFEDRKRGADASSKISIDGHDAVVFEVDGTAPIGKTFYAMWLDGEHSLELRSDVIPTFKEFSAIAATLHRVAVDTWLSAMPASVVTPADRGDAVAKILADVPIPSNVDVEALKNGRAVMNDYSVEGQVQTAIICGWIQQWIDGTKTGDKGAVREAAAVMATSRDWLDNYGAASYVQDVADAMPDGSPINGDTSLAIGVGYQRHIGCPEN